MMWKDLEYALRALRRSPGFAAAAVLSLALGLGANTALFSAVDAVLLRPLPYRDPGRLVRIWSSQKSFPQMPSSIPDLRAYRDDTKSFEALAGYYSIRRNLAVPGKQPEGIVIDRTTAELSSVLGVGPAGGRWYGRGEEARGRAP